MTSEFVKHLSKTIRRFSTKPSTNEEIKPLMYNRNPRNLEFLRIDRKPTGYPLEKGFVSYWHKVEVKETKYGTVARLIHNTQKVVVEASTKEWGISKQLCSTKDKMAYITLAKVFAQRCLETGIYSFHCDICEKPTDKSLNKVQLFVKVLEEEGLMLSEMPQFDMNKVWYLKREKRPWTVLEDEHV